MTTKTLISFDYAIKYLLRNKSDYDIVESFISALIGAAGHSPVKIKAILESESNREKSTLKRSIADMIVEDEAGEKYIVEIEREETDNFVHKACFNTSRLIVDNMSGGEDYTTIKKVFHISLLYFVWGNMQKPMYHGETIFREIDSKHPMDLRLADNQGHTFDANHVLPEYFFISIPLFNDEIKKELDEWLYVMKHSEVKEDFKSPAMQKVAQRLQLLKMSDDERTEYHAYMKETLTHNTSIRFAEARGRQEGIEEGREKGKIIGLEAGKKEERKLLIKQLQISGMDVNAIHKATQISIEEISDILK